MTAVFMMIGGVSAAHSSSVSVSPSGWLKPGEVTSYEFTITNTGTTSFEEVIITKPIGYPLPITCEDAPSGWELFEEKDYRCGYYTTNPLENGESETFSIQITNPSFGEYTWAIKIDGISEEVTSIVKTIQSAIDNWDGSSVITVPAGTYEESIVIDRELTLIGDGDVIISGDELSNYIVKITADNVVFDNFEVNGGGDSEVRNPYYYGIWISNAENVEIKNSEIKNIWKDDANGIQVDDSINSDIHNNTISSFYKRGIRYVNSDGEFYDNEVVGEKNVDGTTRVQNLVNINGGSDVEVYENELYNALTDPDETPTWDSPGIVVSSYNWGTNDVSSYADIHDNEIYDSDSGIVIGSVYSTSDSSTADITGNYIHNTADAIVFEVERDNGSGDNDVSAVIHENIFTDNGMNIVVIGTSTTTIDATYNWWGTANETKIQDLIDGDVDYDPWCFDAECSEDDTKPEMEFIGAPYFGLIDSDVVITANVSDDRALANYILYFGDGKNVTGNFAGEHNLSAIVNVTHPYGAEGEYIVNLTVTDKIGNTASDSTAIVVSSEKPDWVIPLKANEPNFISLPFVPENTDYKEVLGGIKDSLDRFWAYVYDEESGENVWKYKYVTDSGSWSGSTGFSDIVPGYGYIVFMKNNDVLYGNARGGITQDDPEGGSSEIPWMPIVKLSNRGYNLIGVFGYKDANKSLESLESAEGYRLYRSILDVDGKAVTEKSELELNKAYWLSMAEPYNSNLNHYEYKL